jgi:hypothetical protein
LNQWPLACEASALTTELTAPDFVAILGENTCFVKQRCMRYNA